MTKKWIDVTLSSRAFSYRQEMYEWCQEKFGPGKDWFDDQVESQPKWKRLVYEDDSISFFFANQDDALLFALRWQ